MNDGIRIANCDSNSKFQISNPNDQCPMTNGEGWRNFLPQVHRGHGGAHRGRRSQVVRREAGPLCDANEHTGSDLSAVVEGPDVIGPATSSEDFVRSTTGS